MAGEVAVKTHGLYKRYQVYRRPADRLKQALIRSGAYYREKHALHPLDLTIGPGEMVGIIGRNGSGKSTLLQLLCGTLTPSGGELEVNGRISALLELGAGFNPEFTGKENVKLNAAILGLSEPEIAQKYDDIIAFSGLSAEDIAQPVRTYSSGMYVRLAFAVAASVEPDIFIVDEALAVGDEAFQRKCYARIRELQSRGTTVLFVSHSPRAILELCDRAIWLDGGHLILDDTPKYVLSRYQRFLYAPEEEQASYLHALRHDREHREERIAEEPTAPGFLPSLKVETTVVYAPNGAEIQHVRLQDEEDAIVNVLETGKTYRLCYDVTFDEAAKDVRFGMLIKGISGMEIGGASMMSDTLAKVEAGQRVEVRIKFVNRLLEGTYFINCGCSAKRGEERTFLHRIHDALMFKVISDSDHNATGTIDFSPSYHVDIADHA